MFKCIFCGLDNPSDKARFCIECGPDGPAKEWTLEAVDQPGKVIQYASMLGEFYFAAQTGAEVERYSLRMRERLKISHDTHAGVIEKLAAQKKAIAHLANFRLDFNENVTDAYAGHDTYLSFRYTNLSEDEFLKVSLVWDDPGTTDRVDLRAQTGGFVKPQGAAALGGSVIFDRMGTKELVDMQITITDQFGESAKFKAEPFSFKVGSHEQRVTNNISTHNQISIEGRGVVDASGMGTDKATTHLSANSQPRWRELSFSYMPQAEAPPNATIKIAPTPLSQQVTKTAEAPKATPLDFDKNDLLSVLKAAEQGHADAQKNLGYRYQLGQGVAQSDEQAVARRRELAIKAKQAAQVEAALQKEAAIQAAKVKKAQKDAVDAEVARRLANSGLTQTTGMVSGTPEIPASEANAEVEDAKRKAVSDRMTDTEIGTVWILFFLGLILGYFVTWWLGAIVIVWALGYWGQKTEQYEKEIIAEGKVKLENERRELDPADGSRNDVSGKPHGS